MKCEAQNCRQDATGSLANREFSRFIKLTTHATERMRRGLDARVCDYHYQNATKPPLPRIMSDSHRHARYIAEPSEAA